MESDTDYFVVSGAHSQLSSYFQSKSSRPSSTRINEEVHHVVASSDKPETSGAFHNAQRATPTRFIIVKLGYLKPPTPLKTDNEITKDNNYNKITQNVPNLGTFASIG